MTDPTARWRLVLGRAARDAFGPNDPLDAADAARDQALEWLYDREPELGARDVRRDGDLAPSQLTVPAWIDEVHRLFPRETIERLERDAVERYQIDEVIMNPDVLARVEPDEALLRAVLRTKHLMSPTVLALARDLVAKVVGELVRRLARPIRARLHGPRARRRSLARLARNFDARATIRGSLDTYDPLRRRLVPRRPIFFERTRRRSEQWQLVLLVDESGSMLGSVIHAAVTAACLWGIPGLRTHLCIFDTAVVDLTAQVTDPVEVLMRVQLGGGTDIGKAVAYAADLLVAPRRAVVVLITDFYEGGDPEVLVRRVATLCRQGTTVLGLAALDGQANPAYDRDLAARLVEAGAQVGAMTPGELAAWIAEKVRP